MFWNPLVRPGAVSGALFLACWLCPALASGSSFAHLNASAQTLQAPDPAGFSSATQPRGTQFEQQTLETLYQVTSVHIEGVIQSMGGAPQSFGFSYVMQTDSGGQPSFHFEPSEDVVWTVRLQNSMSGRTHPQDDGGAPGIPEPTAALAFGAGLTLLLAWGMRTRHR